MSESFYTSTADIEKVDGVHRRAHLATGVAMDVGVHGPIKSYYRLEGEDRPLPVDFIVAATAT